MSSLPSPNQLLRSTNPGIQALTLWLKHLKIHSDSSMENLIPIKDVSLTFNSQRGAEHARTRVYNYRKAILQYINEGRIKEIRALPCVALLTSNPEEGPSNAEAITLQSFLNHLNMRATRHVEAGESTLQFTIFTARGPMRNMAPTISVVESELTDLEQQTIASAMAISTKGNTNNAPTREGTYSNAEDAALSEIEQYTKTNTDAFIAQMQELRDNVLEIANKTSRLDRLLSGSTLKTKIQMLHKQGGNQFAYSEVIALAAAIQVFEPNETYYGELKRRYPDIFAQYTL